MQTVPIKSSMDGAPSPDVGTVKLWPYLPGVYGRDCLYRVWAAMEAEGATHRAFWDRASFPDTCGDLASFIKAFDGNPSTQLALVEGPPDQRLIGCIWVSDVIPTHQAFISIWMKRGSQEHAIDAGRQVIDYSFATWNLRQLWAVTPWQRAMALAVRLRFRRVAVMPEYCRYGEHLYDVHVLRLTKEQWNADTSHHSSIS